MLSEQRYALILEVLEKKRSITVNELTELLNISESTARRDITALDKAGRLVKVFGGAIALEDSVLSSEPTVAQKTEVQIEEKKRIAKYAASLIEPKDFVYLDAGTTTGYMIEYLEERSATFVTNAVAHAQRLAAEGVRVFMIGGELKSSTEAIIGSEAVMALKNYHFTKGFFGTNGISKVHGFTTPDINEALVKKTAMNQCKRVYVLGDYSKYNVISSVTFSVLKGRNILSDQIPEEFKDMPEIVLC